MPTLLVHNFGPEMGGGGEVGHLPRTSQILVVNGEKQLNYEQKESCMTDGTLSKCFGIQNRKESVATVHF